MYEYFRTHPIFLAPNIKLISKIPLLPEVNHFTTASQKPCNNKTATVSLQKRILKEWKQTQNILMRWIVPIFLVYLFLFINQLLDVSNKTGSIFMLNKEGILRSLAFYLIDRSLCDWTIPTWRDFRKKLQQKSLWWIWCNFRYFYGLTPD